MTMCPCRQLGGNATASVAVPQRYRLGVVPAALQYVAEGGPDASWVVADQPAGAEGDRDRSLGVFTQRQARYAQYGAFFLKSLI